MRSLGKQRLTATIVFKMFGRQYQKEIREGENENYAKHDIVLSYKNVLTRFFLFFLFIYFIYFTSLMSPLI